jgi:hypothetical protein
MKYFFPKSVSQTSGVYPMDAFLSEIQHEFTFTVFQSGIDIRVAFINSHSGSVLLKRINVPGIIGLIVAGVIIGPTRA